MGSKLSASEAGDAIESIYVLFCVASALGSLGTFAICYFLPHNYNFFPSKIMMRICITVGVYNFVRIWNPDAFDDDKTWSDTTAYDFPVINRPCYVQAVLVVALDNLSVFWNCCLIHNTHDVVVNKNLRPEDNLKWYDHVSLGLAFLVSLAAWSVTGYGWQWYGRCRYNLYETGDFINAIGSLIQGICMLYVLWVSFRMFLSMHVQASMISDYRLAPALKRHNKNQTQYILVSFAFVLTRVFHVGIEAYQVVRRLTVGNFLVMPDDLPYALVLLDVNGQELFGLLCFIIFLSYDFLQVRTRLVRNCICCKSFYWTSKDYDYVSEGRAFSDRKFRTYEDREEELALKLVKHVEQVPDAEPDIFNQGPTEPYRDAYSFHNLLASNAGRGLSSAMC